jgi:hypothetical protein
MEARIQVKKHLVYAICNILLHAFVQKVCNVIVPLYFKFMYPIYVAQLVVSSGLK